MDIEATLDQVERLRQALVDYALSPGFERRLAAVRRDLGTQGVAGNLVDAVESLLYDGADGKEPLLERYLRTNKSLSAEDRDAYEGWCHGNCYGVFRIEESNGPELLLYNLIDEMDYRTIATAGIGAGNPAPKGGYAMVRLVPTGTLWTVSGNLQLFPKSDRHLAEDLAVKVLQQFPRLPYRNPDKLEGARTMVREQHRIFLDAFGSHVVMGTGAETITAYRSFMEALRNDAASREPGNALPSKTGRQLAPDSNFPAELRGAEDVALFHHPVKSTSFLVGYREALDAHLLPPADADKPGAERIREYMFDDSVPAHVLMDLAAQFPSTVNEAYRAAFSIPDFEWKHDGALLLRECKPTDMEDADIPDITSVPTPLRAAYLRLAQGA